jgi:restriction system protein
MAKSKKAEFTRWFNPVLVALKDLGGSGRAKEVIEQVAKNENVSDEIREITIKDGSSKFDNQVAWARQYLAWEGLIDSSKRGVWTLTPLGEKTVLTENDAHEMFLKRIAIYQRLRKEKDGNGTGMEINGNKIIDNPDTIENTNLLDVLKSISPIGFEHLCKRLLREHGFDNLEVTQRSHDEGIDGYGTLELNPFIKIKIIFQCKRYKSTVSREKVGDFRNAVMGRAEKGIIMTTGTFSEDAKREAEREGVIPIELIDGEKLIELFQQVELGVRAKTIYEIDYKFFDEYYSMK